MRSPIISLIRNAAILICVASIVSILFKMQDTTAGVNYSFEFTLIAIIAPFATISNGFRFSIFSLIGMVMMVGAAIEINYDFYTESILKIMILWVVYVIGYLISDISSDNHKVV